MRTNSREWNIKLPALGARLTLCRIVRPKLQPISTHSVDSEREMHCSRELDEISIKIL